MYIYMICNRYIYIFISISLCIHTYICIYDIYYMLNVLYLFKQKFVY